MIVTIKTIELEILKPEEEFKFHKTKERIVEKINFSDSAYILKKPFQIINFMLNKCVAYNEEKKKIEIDFDRIEEIQPIF
jgi:hypothetical protein